MEETLFGEQVVTTRDLGRLVSYYKEHIRDHSSDECVGVIRNMQAMLKKGVTLDQIMTALKNYENDPWVKKQDQRYRKHIRSFFSKAVIMQWQEPMPQFKKKPQAEIINVLDNMTLIEVPPATPVEVEDIEDADYEF